jgi:hypothetical protein
MSNTLSQLLPLFLGFLVVFAAKKAGWVPSRYGSILLKLSLYITIPALLVVSVARVSFTHQLLIFPLLSGIVLAMTFVLMRPLYKRLRLPAATEGTFRIAPLTINSGFVVPFVVALFGGEGIMRIVLFNAGYNPLLLLGVYGIAAAYNPHTTNRRQIFKRILVLPPLWALLVGVLLNITNIQLASPVTTSLQFVGSLTVILMVVALGLLFDPRHIRLDKTLAVVGLRMGVGLAVGLVVVTALRLQGIDRAIVLALAAAPIGFNLLTFASIEKLDQELAASAVSLSILVALILTPLILLAAR